MFLEKLCPHEDSKIQPSWYVTDWKWQAADFKLMQMPVFFFFFCFLCFSCCHNSICPLFSLIFCQIFPHLSLTNSHPCCQAAEAKGSWKCVPGYHCTDWNIQFGSPSLIYDALLFHVWLQGSKLHMWLTWRALAWRWLKRESVFKPAVALGSKLYLLPWDKQKTWIKVMFVCGNVHLLMQICALYSGRLVRLSWWFCM